MKTNGRFNLTWPKFAESASNSFIGFMERQEFVDVTLVCDDQNQVQAHRVILSACSDFFRDFFIRNPSVSHPFIFLDNISFLELKNVISFIYNGEAEICQEDFTRFMKAAQRLKVKGLSDEVLEKTQEVPDDMEVREETEELLAEEVLKKTVVSEDIEEVSEEMEEVLHDTEEVSEDVEEVCPEVPEETEAEREERSPRRARYRSVIKKEDIIEELEPVKLFNVMDALSKSMWSLQDQMGMFQRNPLFDKICLGKVDYDIAVENEEEDVEDSF